MDTQLLIPEKIKIGFQTREGTYTGKLAYVIYYDTKGKLRKESSWESWRHKDIDPVEFTNEPTEGFVLNKKVGGYKSDWNYRSAHIRVYDPRDFEFEISVENLLFILNDSSCIKGKGLEGKFVYSWSGTELVLLPCESQNYKNSSEFTGLQKLSVYQKDLVPGYTYLTKKQELLTYIGKLDTYYNCVANYYKDREKHETKNHVFLHQDGKTWSFMKDAKLLATCHSDSVVSNYAELREAYHHSEFGTKIKALSIVETPNRPVPQNRYYKYWVIPGPTSDTYYMCQNSGYDGVNQVGFKVVLENGRLVNEHVNYHYMFKSEDEKKRYSSWYKVSPSLPYFDFRNNILEVEMESGRKFFYEDTYRRLQPIQEEWK